MSDIFDMTIGANAKMALKAFVDNIEQLEEEKVKTADIIKEVYAEAKSTGFDVKILRKVISRRKLEREQREEIDALIDVYENKLFEADEDHESNERLGE